MNKTDCESYEDKVVHNLITYESNYIIAMKPKFNSFHEVHSVMAEEIEETAEELEELKTAFNEYWKGIRSNISSAVLFKDLEIIEQLAVNIINEAKQVGAVAKKARLQLSIQNEKAHATDQSKHEPFAKNTTC